MNRLNDGQKMKHWQSHDEFNVAILPQNLVVFE
jgi:hypothetical protein